MTLFDRWLWHVRMRDETSDLRVRWAWRTMMERTVTEWRA
jgi:hypothetical protein